MANYVRENYYYMLDQLGMSFADFQRDSGISASTETRIRKGNPENTRDSTINILVEYYNKHGHLLYPPHVDFDTFKTVCLSQIRRPRWENRQIAGNYVCLHLSKRGTGKPKAMVLSIKENAEKQLIARCIDIVQAPEKAEAVIKQFLETDDLEAAMAKHRKCLESSHPNYPLLRGSNYLTGTVSGSGDLITITLSDEHNTHEVRISTLLTHYLNTCHEKQSEPYKWRGGAAIANVTDIQSWPYSMVIGMIRMEHWHPHRNSLPEITAALQRMHSYQKKENILSLHSDIDSLFYEVFMEIERQNGE